MKFQRFSKIARNRWLALVAVALLCPLSSPADTAVTPTVVQEEAGGNQKPTETAADPNSYSRGLLWDSSFDRAGDATKAVEQELKQGSVKFHCDDATLNPTNNASPEQLAERKRRCLEANQSAQGFATEAGNIRSLQYIFADASRASDIAAVGAIGATGYAQLFKKKSGQADTLIGAANIQETAGMASYVSGAADFSMGAYAYAMQKRRLEKMQETINGKMGDLKMNADNSALVNKLATAAEQTKKAAYSHMLYGAGKVAFGYASMYLAKQNRQQAESLSSIPMPVIPPGATATPTVSAPPIANTGDGAVPYYQNNDPQILMPSDSSGSSATASGGTNTPLVAGGGASVMSPEMRLPASTFNRGGSVGGGGGGLLKAAGGGGGGGGGSAESEKTDETSAASKQTMGDSFEMNLSGGGGSRYGGGSGGGKEEEASVASLLSSVIGGTDASKSSATGVNPNHLFKEATADLDGSESQGSMAGVGSKERSLFQAIKTKYNKMMEGGRVQGPGSVEVRN